MNKKIKNINIHKAKPHELIMIYAMRDGGFEIDIDKFNNVVESNGNRTFFTTVRFEDYSFELETTHFNINSLVDKIKNILIEKNHPKFSYKIDAHNPLTQMYFEELNDKFGHEVSRKETLYNPYENSYTTSYTMTFVNPDLKYKNIQYIHRGDIEDYVPGSILKFIISKADKDLFISHHRSGFFAKSVLHECKKSIPNKKVAVGDTLYSIQNNKYLQPIFIGNKEFRFMTETINEIDHVVLDNFLKENALEYLF